MLLGHLESVSCDADLGDCGADEVGAEEDIQRVPVGSIAAAGGRHHCQSAELLQVCLWPICHSLHAISSFKFVKQLR